MSANFNEVIINKKVYQKISVGNSNDIKCFALGEEIGRGSFGVVYEGYEITAKGSMDETKPLAIKIYQVPSGKTQQELQSSLEKEAEIQRTRFPTDVYAVGRHEVVMIMPRFPGKSLDKWMRTPEFIRLTLSQRLELACAVMQAYAEFHAMYARKGVGLSHTDLKPGNFLIHIYYDEEKDPKHEHPKFECHIIDFANIRIRTPITAAPECVHGEKIGQKAHHVLEMEIHSLVSILAPILGEDVLYENKLNLWDEKCKFTLEHMKAFLRKEVKGNELVQEIEEVIELIESMQHENPAMRPTDLVILKTLNRIRIACLRQEQRLEKEEIDDDTKSINAFFAAIKAGDLVGVRNQILSMGQEDVALLFNRFGAEGLMPLGVAVKYGQYDIAQHLLSVGGPSQITQKDGYGFNGRPLLHLAILSERADLVELLLKNGAEVNQVDADGRTPLHCAISRRCNVDLVKKLLEKGADFTAEEAGRRTPVQLAIANACSLEVVQVLIEEKEKQVKTTKRYRLFLAMHSGSVELVKCFYEPTALDSVLDQKGQIWLHFVASSGHVPLVEFLIDEINKSNEAQRERGERPKYSIDDTDVDGNTALHYAAMKGQLKMAILLLEQGADGTKKNKANHKFHEIQEPNGLTLLHIAVINGDLDAVKRLVEEKANIETKNRRGYTPLQYALLREHVEVAQYLIESGAVIDEKNSEGATLLHLAAAKGLTEIVKIFNDRNLDKNARDNKLRTPLHDAIRKGHVEVARYLIANGADMNALDINGQKPLDLATAKEVKDLLLRGQKKSFSGAFFPDSASHLHAKPNPSLSQGSVRKRV